MSSLSNFKMKIPGEKYRGKHIYYNWLLYQVTQNERLHHEQLVGIVYYWSGGAQNGKEAPS